MNNIIAEKKLFVFDLDGTVYLGSHAFPFAIDFIKNLKAAGKRVLFFTNNASKNHATYISKLSKMGFDVEHDEILTSADVTAQFLLKHRAGKTVYLLGTEELEDYFISKDIKIVNKNEKPDIVLVSFDLTLTYEKLEHACTFVRKGAEFLATHPDINCPTENGSVPDCGAICTAITASTGSHPLYLGKPSEDCGHMICQHTGFKPEDICIFGDRIYTDIALGINSGFTSVLVLSGETTEEDIKSIKKEHLPDFIYPSLKEVGDDIFNNS